MFALLAALLAASMWEDGARRPFLAASPSLGAMYSQVNLAAGFGRPYFEWAGVEGFGFSCPSFNAIYAGLHASYRVFDLRAGVRRSVSTGHSFAPVASAHRIEDFESAGPKANYTALEVEISGGLPAPGGFALWDLEWLGLRGVPAGYDVYEEFIKVAARPPSVAAARLGWVVPLDGGRLVVGAGSDLTATFGRGTIARVGPIALYQFTDHLGLFAAGAFALRTPDSLGWFYGTYGTVVMQWKWATGEVRPHFP